MDRKPDPQGLPARYFLLTFTLPEQLRDLAWKNQQIIYSLMFSCVQETLKTFAGNDRKLGGTAGFTTILHTNTRSLDYHPHIHVVMPGATINLKTGLWRVKDSGYLFNHKALAKVFRAKLLQTAVDHGLEIPGTCPKEWVVDCRDVGNGDKAIIYLGRYFSGALSGSRISCTAMTIMSLSGIFMQKQKPTELESLPESIFSICSCSTYCQRVFAGHAVTGFFIHAVKNLSSCCNWCSGSIHWANLRKSSKNGRKLPARYAEMQWRLS